MQHWRVESDVTRKVEKIIPTNVFKYMKFSKLGFIFILLMMLSLGQDGLLFCKIFGYEVEQI